MKNIVYLSIFLAVLSACKRKDLEPIRGVSEANHESDATGASLSGGKYELLYTNAPPSSAKRFKGSPQGAPGNSNAKESGAE